MAQMKVVIPVSSLKSKDHQESNKESGESPAEKIEICWSDIPFQIVRPLLVTMRLFGLLFLNSNTNKWYPIATAYSVFVLAMFWGSFIQMFFAYKDTKWWTDSFFKIIVHVWYLQCSVNAMITFKSWGSENRFAKFLLEFSRLLKMNRQIPDMEDPCTWLKTYKNWARRKTATLLTIAWLFVITNTFGNGYLLYKTQMTDFIIAPMSPSNSLAVWMKAVVLLIHVYRTAAWVFSAALFMMMAGMICREFEVVHKDLRAAVSPNGDIVGLDTFRRRHQRICQLVEAADDVLSAFNAAGLVFSTCNGMPILYNLVYNSSVMSDQLTLGMHCLWLFLVMVYLILIAYGGGYLNHLAHAPLRTIHSVVVKDPSPELCLQMNMFLNKFTGEPIGLTALGMFVIDKPTILTIAGAFVTYFIVLIQFRQPIATSPGAPICNCTDFFVNSTFSC